MSTESGSDLRPAEPRTDAAISKRDYIFIALWSATLASLPAVCAALKPLPDAHAFTCSFQIECVTASSAVDESRSVTLCGTNSSTMVRLIVSSLFA